MCRVLFATLLASTLVGDARADIMTPPELQPDDQFRIVFVTDTATPATSSDLADYDMIVQSDAIAGCLDQYNGLSVMWQVIGSTATISAVSRLPADDVPVYLPSGTEVAVSGTALWDSSNVPLLHLIDETPLGTRPPDFVTWTGTNSDGTGHAPFQLGNPSPLVWYGNNTQSTSAWIAQGADMKADPHRLYGISEVLTVPESP